MKIYNYFTVHWVNGYNYLSDAPGDITLFIESWRSEVPPYKDRARIESFYDKENRMSLGVLAQRVFIKSKQRNCDYYHIVAFPDSRRNDFNEDIYQELFKLAYGDDIAHEIEIVHNKVGGMRKLEGRSIVEAHRVTPEMLNQAIENVKHLPESERREIKKSPLSNVFDMLSRLITRFKN
jgi:hypothetical protein